MWNTGSPEAQRQVIAARRLCAIAASIRASDNYEPWSPQSWPFEFRGCRYIALVAVAQNGHALAQDGRALEYAMSHLRADKEVVLAAVAKNGCALQYAAAALRADKEVVLAAVAQTGWALSCADSDLRADKEVVLAAVAQDGFALRYAASELQMNKKVVRAARYAAEEARADNAAAAVRR